MNMKRTRTRKSSRTIKRTRKRKRQRQIKRGYT